MRKHKLTFAFIVVALSAFSIGQLGDLGKLIKVGGVALLVDQFGGEMNKGLNRLTKHNDSATVKTKVVTILSVGIGRSHAIGAAQVMGPPDKVDKVVAIAQPEADLLGRQIRLRALIPVSDKNVTKAIKTVDGVGVSGIVDIKL
ncbi:MAG: hypothetical protein ABL949_15430 [Fimbriimonadaceae bacterium]